MRPTKLQDRRASTARPCRCPTASTRRGFPWRAPTSTAAQQQSKLASAWYQLPAARRRPPAGGDHRRGHASRATACSTGTPTGQTVELEYARPGTRRCAGARRPGGPRRHRVRAVVAQPALRPRPRSPPTPSRFASSPRTVSLTPGDWIAVTPPRVPELRSLQEYVGSQPAGADGLGGRAGVPVPAADAARQRRDRGAQVPDHTGLHRQDAGHRHLGGRPSTAACSASPTCCCART